MQDVKFGDVTVNRIVELYEDASPPEVITPDMPRERWEENRSWLVPNHWNPQTDAYVGALQSWLLRSGGRNILIDTGAGNGKDRPQPQFSNLRTDFLGNLAASGVRPEDIDVVINTHLHLDHTGWNTYRVGEDWVPTFPNATYLISKTDFDFWNPAYGNESVVLGKGNYGSFEDSVLPVHQAGQTLLWEDSYTIDENIRLELTPGHTPGASVVQLQSGSDRVLFASDTLHVPMQILEPDCNSCFCEDPAAARAVRHKLLGWAADNNALFVPGHFVDAGCVEVARAGARFSIKGWGPFEALLARD